ncbi:DUF2218 domain-containing protein [Leucothrix arctica]|uniref:DUF2218 domain-containing protein n=1 Tax=Leucothrix arctica TaxID=1481894 RepID=A0A317C9X0_9GAMM|nr:DUF2218 domain-containing protein [Leucothrix arctica]PWQ95167.1 hypothetical protein DKT75_12520 [Leucothrix arctica]
MKYLSNTQVSAEKSQRYINSLGKHFARKIPVDFEENEIIIRFEMGICTMSAAGEEMNFVCAANSSDDLEIVKDVIGSHIIKYGELKEVTVTWTDQT